MPVGVSVSEYEKTKNPYVNKFSSTGLNTPISAFNPAKSGMGLSSMTATQKPTNLSSTSQPGGQTALGNGGGRNIQASPMLNAIPEQTFQPYYTGNSRGNMFGAGRLAAIDEMGEIANDEIQQKVMLKNAEIQRRNRVTAQQDQWRAGNPFGGSFSGGGGDSGLDDEQATNARVIANIGRQRGMSDGAIQIALMTALTESGLRNVNYGDRDSLGLFQQRPSQGWGTAQQVSDPTYAANKFYDSLSKVNFGAMSPWAAAQAVQRSFDPTGSNYQRQYALAQKAFGSLNAPQGQLGNSAVANFITQNNNKYIDWDGAYGAQCVDLYNKYTATFVGGKNIMVGWADEIFNKYDASAYRRVGSGVQGGMGYVAVFGKGGATPSGHVGIVVGDNGNGTLRILQANATSLGSSGPTIISNISKASLLGYLIPNKLLGG